MLRKVLKIIGEILIYIAIVVAIVWGVPTFLSKKLGTEYPIAAITSGSMWPALKTNDLVLIQKVPKEDLKIGDVVVWQNPKGFTIHRIVNLASTTLTTKGDANFTKDEPVPYSDLVGRTVMFGKKPLRVPYFGFISVFAGNLRNQRAQSEGAKMAPNASPTKVTPGKATS